MVCSLNLDSSHLPCVFTIFVTTANQHYGTTLSQEEKDVFKNTTKHHMLEISRECAPNARFFLDGIPEVHDIPEIINLRSLVETKPLDAMIQLIRDHVMVRGWWESFFKVMEQIGLGEVKERFFDRALKGVY